MSALALAAGVVLSVLVVAVTAHRLALAVLADVAASRASAAWTAQAEDVEELRGELAHLRADVDKLARQVNDVAVGRAMGRGR